MAEQVDLFDCCSDFMEIILSVSTTAEINHYRVTMDDQLRNRSQSPPVNSSFRNIVSASRPINIQQETSKLIAAAKRQRQANLKLKRLQAFSAITWD